MALTIYKPSVFDFSLARNGALCLMVPEDFSVSDNSTIDAETIDYEPYVSGREEVPCLKWVGVCRFKEPYLIARMGGTDYYFNTIGSGSNLAATKLKLILGTIDTPQSASDTILSPITTTVTRNSSGEGVDDSVTVESDKSASEINIQSLHARDSFALHALRGIMERMPNSPDEVSDSEMRHFSDVAYKWAANMMMAAAQTRAELQEEDSGEGGEEGDEDESSGSSSIDVTSFDDNTEKLLKNIELAIKSTLTNSINDKGKDSSHPIYISGGGFPSRHLLAAILSAADIHDFLTFNTAGAVGYSTKEEVKKSVLGYLDNYASLTSLSSAIYNNIQSAVDSRIRSWLQAARVTVDGTSYTVTINTPS